MRDVSLEGLSAEQITGLATLAKGLGDNPTTRKEFMRLMKRSNPEMSIPEVDLPDEMLARITAESEARQKLEAQLMEAQARELVRERRETIKTGKGLTDAQVIDIEKLMVEKHIGSHDTAADFYLAQQKMAEPTPSFVTPRRIEVPVLDQLRTGKSMVSIMETAAHKAIDELRVGAN